MEPEVQVQQSIQEKIKQRIDELNEKAVKIGRDRKTKVDLAYFIERTEDGQETGRVFGAFIQQPHILVSARAMDMLVAQKIYEAGNMMFDACVIKEETDSEVLNNDKYKLGLMGKIGMQIDIQLPEIKKN